MIYNTFTAANSSKGFYSLFDGFIRADGIDRVYLIKGGPGCGKSTFMKKVAAHFDALGYTVERAHCSSDPDSLDGVHIKEKGAVIIDATPPHSYDMKYPGAVDSLIDLSAFWDNSVLDKSKNEMVGLTDGISSRYKSVYSVLKSAGILFSQQCADAEQATDAEKAVSFIKRAVKQNAFTPINSNSKVQHRFLSAINCNGITCFTDTATALCESCIVIDDEYTVAGGILTRFISYFRKCGYDIMIFYNPLCPESRIDHIIIPRLKFGIFTSNKTFTYDINESIITKRINSRSFIDKAEYDRIKNKMSFRKKMVSELINDCVSELLNIKSMHDELEKYYINAVDHDSLNKYTEQFIASL